jgi:tetratricopeptide (TPR) repeat protein
MEVPLAEVEGKIFDCDYFKAKLVPLYQENPEDLATIRYTFNKLKTQGCADTDPIMVELKTKYEAKAANMNAAMQEDFLAKNPGMAARKLYEEGNFSQAIAKYQEALSTETDDSKKADYYLGIASIQFRQLKSYGPARENARKAASLKSNWGRPYLLIGDMYASTSRNCGSDGYSRGLAVLAAIEKYAQARNIDAEVSAEASKKMSLYSASIPPKDEAHMRGMAEGARVSTGCWIGETVTLRYN